LKTYKNNGWAAHRDLIVTKDFIYIFQQGSTKLKPLMKKLGHNTLQIKSVIRVEQLMAATVS